MASFSFLDPETQVTKIDIYKMILYVHTYMQYTFVDISASSRIFA